MNEIIKIMTFKQINDFWGSKDKDNNYRRNGEWGKEKDGKQCTTYTHNPHTPPYSNNSLIPISQLATLHFGGLTSITTPTNVGINYINHNKVLK